MARRGHNEGSIYKRSDGRWAGTITVGYEAGKRRRKTYYGETRKEVQEQLTAALRTHQQGLPLASERQTVGQFLEEWLADSHRPTIRAKKYATYRYIIHSHLIPGLGRIALGKLTAKDVQVLLQAKLSSGLSARTVHHCHAVLKTALEFSLRWDLVSRNVAKLVKSPHVKRTEVAPLEPEQALKLLEVVRGHRLEALYTVALAIGLREGEALGLRWEDVDLDRGTLSVRVALQR